MAVLLVLLMPAIAGVRERAHLSGCASNLRGIHAGITAYMGDNEGRYPPFVDTDSNPSRDWSKPGWLPQILEPYLDSPQVWNCPAQPESRHLGYGSNSWRAGKNWYIPSYSVNSVIAGRSQEEVFASMHPHRQIFMTEGQVNFWDKNSASQSYVQAPHGGSSTNVFLFADGRIATGSKDDIIVYTAGGGSAYRVIALSTEH